LSLRADLTEDAIEQFFALPIFLQEPLDERLERLAENEAIRDRSLAPDAERRHRFHTFNLDLDDTYWHEFSVVTKFDPTRDVMRVFSIGYQSMEK
jgi:cytidylate kinase